MPAPRTERPVAWGLFALTVSAGCIDAASYLGLGNVFTANMTGNVLLLGFAAAGEQGLALGAFVLSLAAFLAGAVAGGRASRKLDLRRLFAAALLVEGAVLLALAALVALADPGPGTVARAVTIGVLAATMGMRTAVVRAIGISDLRTTVLTLTVASLGADSRLAGGTGERTRVRAGAVAAMVCGALIGALLEQVDVALPLAAAAVVALAALVVYRPTGAAPA